MPGGKRVIPNPYNFRQLKRKLVSLGICWSRKLGKGSHGAFTGPDRHGRTQAYTLPRDQQKQVDKPYLNGLRRRFELEGPEWDEFFAG